MADVTFFRQDYLQAATEWQLIRDFVEGERAVKVRGKAYLPDPNAVETGDEAGEIYKRYLQRASVFGATGNTVRTLIGAAFRKWPTLTLPPLVEYLQSDADGNGVSIYQQSQKVSTSVFAIGRHALFVDYPNTDEPASLADMQSGRIRANILSVKAEDVINWRVSRVGAVHQISLVVFRESVDVDLPDGFGYETVYQYRVLRMQEGVYTQEVWRLDAQKVPQMTEGPFVVTDGAGVPFSFIPFTFVGAENNDDTIDHAPVSGLARLNMKHYQVAADWYNALFYAGQPQPWMSGLDEGWRNWLNEQGFIVGSRAVIPLPAGGQFGFATVPAETAIQKEIKDIEARMVAIGARLIQPGGAVKTATEAQGEQESTYSVLSLVIENVNEAYTQAIKWAVMFMDRAGMGANVEDVNYRINTEFAVKSMDAQMVTAAVALFNSGQWPKSDLFTWLRKHELIDPEKTDEEIAEELEGQEGGNVLAQAFGGF